MWWTFGKNGRGHSLFILSERTQTWKTNYSAYTQAEGHDFPTAIDVKRGKQLDFLNVHINIWNKILVFHRQRYFNKQWEAKRNLRGPTLLGVIWKNNSSCTPQEVLPPAKERHINTHSIPQGYREHSYKQQGRGKDHQKHTTYSYRVCEQLGSCLEKF